MSAAGAHCGQEDSNLQPVSRPDPKFGDGSPGSPVPSAPVLICAVQAGTGDSKSSGRNAFVLASVAASVRSFVRCQSDHCLLSK